MERTQIYLGKREKAALARASKETGRTRSQLIREAIEARYPAGAAGDPDIVTVLRRTAGLWADRSETGEEYVERLRGGRRLDRLYDSPSADQDAPGR